MSEPQPPQSESRDRVLNAAYVLFLQSGMTGVSMQQIADEASITKATLYHHFRDKQDLYIETMRLAMTNNQRALVGRINGSTDIHTAIRELVSYVFGNDRADLQRLAADFKEHVDTDTQHQFWKQFRPPWHLMQGAVEAAMAQGQIAHDDSTFVSRYIYGATAGLSQLYRLDPEAMPVNDALIARITDTMLNGLIEENAATPTPQPQ